MFRQVNAFILMLTVCLVSACGDKEPAEVAKASLTSSVSGELLQYVPADTPYFLGSLEPFDKSITDAMKPMTESLLESYGELIETVLADADDEPNPLRPFLKILSDELKSDEDYIFGLGYESRMVIYGHGLMPVLRATLDDTKRYDALIARMDADPEVDLKSGKAGDIDFRYLASDEMHAIFARNGDQLIVTATPAAASAELTPLLLGVSKVDKSLADSDRLSTLAATHGYLANYLGYIDTAGLLSNFTGEPSGANKVLFDAVGGPPELSAVCQTEFASLAAVMPEMNFGYTEASTKKFVGKAVLELREDIAAGMQTLAAAVPGVGGDMGGVGFFSFGIDIGAARDFFGARVEAISAKPYQCEQLAGLNEMAAGMQQGLSTPLPPIVNNFKGAAIVVDDIRNFDIQGGQPPEMDVRAILAIDDAPSVLAMGQMFLPPLAALSLEPTGEVIDLPPGLIPGVTDPAYVAISENAVSLGLGSAVKGKLAAMLSAPVTDNPPLQSLGYDMSEYMRFVGDMVEKGEEADTKQALNIMRQMQDVMDRSWFSLSADANGVVIDTTVTLK